MRQSRQNGPANKTAINSTVEIQKVEFQEDCTQRWRQNSKVAAADDPEITSRNNGRANRAKNVG